MRLALDPDVVVVVVVVDDEGDDEGDDWDTGMPGDDWDTGMPGDDVASHEGTGKLREMRNFGLYCFELYLIPPSHKMVTML